jgi:curved DNA-binding protein CbpA
LCYKFFNNAKPKTYYDVIGVSIKATQPSIKKAYFEIVKRYHPDHNKDKNAEVLQTYINCEKGNI